MREDTTEEWRLMSQVAMPMVLGSVVGWQRGRLESGEEGHGARIWSRRRDGGG
jgi:hypothetical protein